MSGAATTPRDRAALVREVRTRVPQPVDTLEIAAVLESMGVTDAVALEDYDAPDTFALAEDVFEAVRPRGGTARVAAEEPPAPRRRREPTPLLDASARGLLALAPLGLLLATLQALAAAGWSTGSILALSFGVTTAMLLTSGPIVAIGRRTSIYLGFGQRAAAGRFAIRASLATLLLCCATSVGVFVAVGAFEVFPYQELAVFSVALTAAALLWLLAAGLTLAGASLLVVAVLVSGVALGVALGAAVGSAAGIAVGYGATVASLAAAGLHRYPRGAAHSLLPPPGRALLVDATPYVAFGTAFALFLVVPHVLGWLGNGDDDMLQRLTTLELSLLLALLPVLLATGVSERILRSFWGFARDLRGEAAADGFRRGVRAYLLAGLVRYTIVLGALSVATAAVFETLVVATGLDGASQLVFLCGLAAFLLLGVGQFCCLFMLGLALPGNALRPLILGLAVLCGLGIPLAVADFRLAAVAFALAAAVFAGAATASCLTVLTEIPRRYSTAF